MTDEGQQILYLLQDNHTIAYTVEVDLLLNGHSLLQSSMDQLSDKLALLGLQEEKAGVMREDIGLEEGLGNIRYDRWLLLLLLGLNTLNDFPTSCLGPSSYSPIRPCSSFSNSFS